MGFTWQGASRRAASDTPTGENVVAGPPQDAR
jgi:hypothetical protein